MCYSCIVILILLPWRSVVYFPSPLNLGRFDCGRSDTVISEVRSQQVILIPCLTLMRHSFLELWPSSCEEAQATTWRGHVSVFLSTALAEVPANSINHRICVSTFRSIWAVSYQASPPSCISLNNKSQLWYLMYGISPQANKHKIYKNYKCTCIYVCIYIYVCR